ncbi:putative DNA-binding transcriptional regulator [Delftia tsuruhatensis]|uniref:type II toxin-antitoxin system HipA family toxin YjjJ n=1 Tax=Delftia tsuruhatensis TaxID=180282 RepID=UPI001E7666A8|nr:type II toxin-antitoxin system HipA family toxin YjjJ [Delftia tsuruhatensis]CAB5679904.1 putative DNA-binding transcriptional regulator [Delftia tsuruhatensis]CAC9693281.1 putative DNA-binding transcriptional regulator [Delftia tsuruhatensis]
MALEELSTQVLAALRRQGGVLSARELQQLLGVSQPTVSRALSPLVHSGQVRKVGAARSQRYVLPRQVAGVGTEVAIMRVDAGGHATPFGRMIALHGGGFWVDEADGHSEQHDGLPWFLDDMRPQGFIGRSFAHNHPELQLGGDPRQWGEDDVLRALARFGEDLPGNLIVGEAAFERFFTLPGRTLRADSPADYPRLAMQALQGTHPGSSAGGEQPKFCCTTAGHSVIVKFSPAGSAPAEQRIRDLLVCEHLALQVLAGEGLPAARTRLFLDGGRAFLESERFDRSQPAADAAPPPPGRNPGRIGMVSLRVLDAQYVGQEDNWAATAGRLAERGLITGADARSLRLLEAYGLLIANNDRHYGNISFVLPDPQGDWALSPTYDMLPMLYMPINGEIVERDFTAPPPTATTLAEWPRALELACRFWACAADDTRISDGFRHIAHANMKSLSA